MVFNDLKSHSNRFNHMKLHELYAVYHPYDGKLFGGPRHVTKYFFQNIFFGGNYFDNSLAFTNINLYNFWLDK